MREGWEYKKLGEVCKIFDNQRKPVTKSNRREGEYPYYGATGIQDYVDSYIFDGRYLLIGEDGAKWSAMENSAYIIEGKSWVNNHAHIIKPTNDAIDTYLMYFLNYSDLDRFISGAIVRKLTQASLKEIDIPLPPLPIQQSIVAELDEINNLLSLKRKELETYDKLAQSIFYEMFGDPVENEKGWETTTLDTICSSIVRGPFGSALKKEFFVEHSDTTYKVYEQKHAIQKDWQIGSYYVTKEKFKELSRFEINAGDIIMSCSGTIGELYRIPICAERGLMNQALLKFTLNRRIEYLYFLFLMDFVKKDFTIRGTGLQNIGSVRIIKGMTFGLPPLPLQQIFASRIEAIETQKVQVKAAIEKLERLLAARMQYWFD